MFHFQYCIKSLNVIHATKRGISEIHMPYICSENVFHPEQSGQYRSLADTFLCLPIAIINLWFDQLGIFVFLDYES